jgi:hypothetical protein
MKLNLTVGLVAFGTILFTTSTVRADALISGGAMAAYDTQSTAAGTISGISAQAALGRTLGSFELLATVSYFNSTVSSTAGSASMTLTEYGGVLYYAFGSHKSAFYLGPRIGVQSVNDGTTTTSSTYYGATVGKRFEIAGPVSFDPNASVSFIKDDTGTSDPRFRIVPLQFTLIF